MEKEFVKYTLDQLKGLVSFYYLAETEWQKVERLIKGNRRARETLMTPPFYWSQFYELSYHELLTSLCAVLLGTNNILALASSNDPQQAALDILGRSQGRDYRDGSNVQIDQKLVTGLLIAHARTVESMVIHSKFLNELIGEVGQGHDGAVFKAVKIDRGVVSCPTIAHRIAQAEIEQDERFFRQLRNAFTGKPKKAKEEYRCLRYILHALDEAGAMENLSLEMAYRLFCEDLELYSCDSRDPARSLWQFISRWKKLRSTPN